MNSLLFAFGYGCLANGQKLTAGGIAHDGGRYTIASSQHYPIHFQQSEYGKRLVL